MDERIRVLWLTKGLGRGGAERLIASSIRHIDRGRVSVEVAFVLARKDAYVKELEEAGVRVHSLGRPRWAGVLWPLRLRVIVRNGAYDIIHTHMPLSAAVARLALSRRPRFVHTEHNVWQRHRRASRWANALTFWRNDAVVAVSESVAQSIKPPRLLSEHVPDIEVLLHGINLEEVKAAAGDGARARRRLGLSQATAVIGTVGNFTHKKDQQTLLRATALLATRTPDLRLVLVGSGPLEPSLRHLAKQLGIYHHIVFAGSRDDVFDLLPAFDVFCLSSQFEGLSIALVEAMASGLACVATRVGGIPEVIEDGISGLLVPPGAPVALATRLDQVLHDDELRRRLQIAARRRARAFDVGRAARRLQDLYEEMMVA